MYSVIRGYRKNGAPVEENPNEALKPLKLRLNGLAPESDRQAQSLSYHNIRGLGFGV